MPSEGAICGSIYRAQTVTGLISWSIVKNPDFRLD
jgi:hypothetical protein